MIKLQFFAFLLRWLASSIGMFFCLTYLGTITENPFGAEHGWLLFALAGLIFSVINSVIKPIISVFALPLAILSLGISTIIVNTIMVIFTIHLTPGVEMGFWQAALSSIILSIINAILNFLIS